MVDVIVECMTYAVPFAFAWWVGEYIITFLARVATGGFPKL